jgi:DNA-binding NarL/FixJ family response regulator
MPAPIRVLLADDHPAIRLGVRALIDNDERMEVVGEANDGAEALRMARAGGVDVLLLDMEMPGMNGVDVALAIQEEGLDLRVLAYSSHDDASFVQGVLAGGASGYITKHRSGTEVLDAIVGVAAGEERWFVSPSKFSEAKPVDPLEEANLTRQEKTVLKLMAKGLKNADIAEVLHVSDRRIRNVLTSVYAKIGVDQARDAVAWCWENGVVDKREVSKGSRGAA